MNRILPESVAQIFQERGWLPATQAFVTFDQDADSPDRAGTDVIRSCCGLTACLMEYCVCRTQ